MTNFIWIKVNFQSFNKNNTFSGNQLRHYFELKVYIEDEDDIDMYFFKNDIDCFVHQSNFENKTCKYISDALYYFISEKYHNKKIKIEISEDDTFGVEMKYPPVTNVSKEFKNYWIGLGGK